MTNNTPLDNLYEIRQEIEGVVVGGQLQRNTFDTLSFTREVRELEELGVLRVEDVEMTLTMSPSEALEIVDQYIQMETL